jgi:thioredoxin-like negative regulator of GroEL
MQVIESSEEFHAILEKKQNICAMFTAQWCPDCQVLKAVLPGLEKEFQGRFDFISVDRDRFTDLAAEYDILGIPSFITFSDGRITGTFISRLRKTRQQIVDFLENAYSKS